MGEAWQWMGKPIIWMSPRRHLRWRFGNDGPVCSWSRGRAGESRLVFIRRGEDNPATGTPSSRRVSELSQIRFHFPKTSFG